MSALLSVDLGRQISGSGDSHSKSGDGQFIQPYSKGRDLTQMIWGAFHYSDQIVIIIERDPNSKKNGYSADSYIEVLEEAIPTLYEPGRTFQQDNAPIHTAQKVTKWFEEQGIETMDWPPYSPDMNPIEHAWRRLKQRVEELYPDLKFSGTSEEQRDEFNRCIKHAWSTISRGFFRRLIWSMPRRVDALRRARGWYTKY